MSIQQYLMDSYTSDVLAEYVKLYTAIIPRGSWPTRKAERAQYLADVLGNPEHLAKIWGAMDDYSHKLLASAYHNGGVLVIDAFIAQYGRMPDRPESFSRYYLNAPLLVDLFLTYEGRLLPELMDLLAPLVPPLERFQVRGHQKLPAASAAAANSLKDIPVAETENAGWHDLQLFLQLVDQGAVTFSAGGNKLTPGSYAALLENLLRGDFYSPDHLERKPPHYRMLVKSDAAKDKAKPDDAIRPFGLAAFARGAGLVTPQGKLSESGRSLLSTQDPHLLLEAFETWTAESEFDEITRIKAIKGLRSRGISITKPGMRRERIVEALSWCPAGVWIDIVEFYRGLKIWRFDFDIEEGGIHRLYIGYRYGNDYYMPWAGAQDMWVLVNGLYINAVLWEYLAVIGAIDIAYLPPDEVELRTHPDADYDEPYYSRYDGLLFFRINPLGAFLFGQAGDYRPPTTDEGPLLRVDADRLITLIDPARLTPVLKAKLEQFAEPEGRAYRLDAHKLLLALEQGGASKGGEGPADFLVRHSAAPLPADVSAWLDEIARAAKAFRVAGPLLRIRAASEELVQLVLADPELGTFCQPLGARDLVIPASRRASFHARLRELGYGLR